GTASSVHRGPPRVGAARAGGSSRAAADDPGHGARPRAAAGGLQLPRALRERRRELSRSAAASARHRRRARRLLQPGGGVMERPMSSQLVDERRIVPTADASDAARAAIADMADARPRDARGAAADPAHEPGRRVHAEASGTDPLLDVRHLKKYFPIRGGLLRRVVAEVKAV